MIFTKVKLLLMDSDLAGRKERTAACKSSWVDHQFPSTSQGEMWGPA
jgi:hypothetical protein